MLHSEKGYRSEEEGMSEISALLKAWMEESGKQEERCQEEYELFKKVRFKQRHLYEEDRCQERKFDKQQYEEISIMTSHLGIL